MDVSGRELKALRKLSPKTGNSLVLTLDSRVQGKLETLMDEVLGENSAEGSAVVMNVQSGEIIAIVSKPSFDPNSCAAGISKKTLASPGIHISLQIKGTKSSDPH